MCRGQPGHARRGRSSLARCNQLGAFGLNQEIRGWDLKDAWQAQFTATKTFANILARLADGGRVRGRGGTTSRTSRTSSAGGPAGRGLRYNAPGTSVSGNPELASRHFGEVEPANRFADTTSWGYRLAGRLEYPNADRTPGTSCRVSRGTHDVKGTIARPRRQFHRRPLRPHARRGREPARHVGVDAAWTRFGGAGRYNDLNDRDFVAASVKYSF